MLSLVYIACYLVLMTFKRTFDMYNWIVLVDDYVLVCPVAVVPVS